MANLFFSGSATFSSQNKERSNHHICPPLVWAVGGQTGNLSPQKCGQSKYINNPTNITIPFSPLPTPSERGEVKLFIANTYKISTQEYFILQRRTIPATSHSITTTQTK
jgi:hypothetical protein